MGKYQIPILQKILNLLFPNLIALIQIPISELKSESNPNFSSST